MKKILVVILVIFSVLVFSIANKKYKAHVLEQQAIAEEKAAIDRAEKAIRSLLKDPDSGKFTEAAFNKKTGAVCGNVNAKNSYGGYVGFLPYIVTSSGTAMISPPDPNVAGTFDFERYQNLVRFLDMHKEMCSALKGQ